MKKERVITCISGIFMGIMIFTIAYASAYSVIIADDFSHAIRIGIKNDNFWEYLVRSIEVTRDTYLTWQGTYFSMFLQALFSPINNLGLPQLRIIMVINVLFFFFAFLFFVYTILKVAKCKMHISVSIMALITYIIVDCKCYEEIFYWYSGAVSYSFPVSFMFIGLAMLIRYNEYHKKKCLIVAVICGVCAMGGSLMVSGTGCYLLLLVCLFYYLKDKKINVANIIVFAIWFIGALVNVLAPGNYVRYGYGGGDGLNPALALIGSVSQYLLEVLKYCSNTTFIAIMLVLFIIGLAVVSKKKFKYIKEFSVVSLFSLFLPIITLLPLSLVTPAIGAPLGTNRAVFCLDVVIVLSFAVLACLSGYWMVEKNKDINIKTVTILLSILSLYCFMDKFDYRESNVLYTARNLYNHTYSNYYSQCAELYERLEQCDDNEDVIIKMSEFPKEIDHYYNFYLSEDSSYWVNTGVARWYNLKSVSLQNGKRLE